MLQVVLAWVRVENGACEDPQPYTELGAANFDMFRKCNDGPWPAQNWRWSKPQAVIVSSAPIRF